MADAINHNRGRSSVAETLATQANSFRSGPLSWTSQSKVSHGQQRRPSGAGSSKAGCAIDILLIIAYYFYLRVRGGYDAPPIVCLE